MHGQNKVISLMLILVFILVIFPIAYLMQNNE